MFTVAQNILHHSLDAHSYDMFAVDIAHDVRPTQLLDTGGMLVNTMLVTFRGEKEHRCECVEDLNQCQTRDVLTHAITLYDMV